METLNKEISARLASGARQLSMAEMAAEYRALGYKFNRALDCRSIARYISGEREGQSYPCLSLYPVQISDGISAWNVDARRDDNFKALQQLRDEVFAVSRGAIAEV